MRHCWQTFFGTGEKEKVKSSLRELEDIGNRYKHIGNQGLEQLTNSITPRLRNLLDVVSILNPVFVESFSQSSSWPRVVSFLTMLTIIQPVHCLREAASFFFVILDLFIDSCYLPPLMRPSSKTCMRGRLKVYFVSIFVYYHRGMSICIT